MPRKPVKQQICGQTEGKMYKCAQCLPSNGLLCEKCYDDGGHKHHTGAHHDANYRGYCDCGNHFYINRETCCPNHVIPNGGTCGNRRGKKYKCSCAKQSNALLCEHCSKKHTGSGHTLTEYESGYGTCDCGDKHYFDKAHFCNDHPGYAMLVGRCWYKSGWLEQKGHGISAAWASKHKRWFQLRHNEIYYYTNEQGAMKRKKRQEDPLGFFRLEGIKVKQDGKTLTLSNVNYDRFFENNQTETEKGAKFVLICPSEEQAESWIESLIYGGAVEN